MNGIILAAVAAFCWAIEAILVKKAGPELNPIIGSAAGTLASGGIFLVYMTLTKNLSPVFSSKSVIYYVLAGIIALVIGRVCYFLAINQTGVSLSVSISASYPLIAVILSMILFKEPITLQKFFGIIMISLGGILLLV